MVHFLSDVTKMLENLLLTIMPPFKEMGVYCFAFVCRSVRRQKIQNIMTELWTVQTTSMPSDLGLHRSHG
jgi:hypothetical protein